jgi:hypothetical protein
MVKVINEDFNSPLFFTNAAHTADKQQRRPDVNRHMVHPEFGLDPVPMLNNNIVKIAQKKVGVSGSELFYPSQLERLVIASDQKSVSELDRFKKMGF